MLGEPRLGARLVVEALIEFWIEAWVGGRCPSVRHAGEAIGGVRQRVTHAVPRARSVLTGPGSPAPQDRDAQDQDARDQ